MLKSIMIPFMKKPASKGYTMLEMLLSLFVFSLSISLLTMVLPLMHKLQNFHVAVDDEIALYQLRHLLLIASEIRCHEDELNFFYLEKEARLILEKNRLVRKDGYVIYMENIKEGSFIQKGDCFYISYEKDAKRKERFLGCN